MPSRRPLRAAFVPAALVVTAATRFAHPTSTGADWIQPYPYLSGGAFSGPALPFTPDPLGQYVWSAGVNASQLQVFFILPQTVTLFGDTPTSSFPGYETLKFNGTVTVAGAGGLQLDFGVNNAAWIEFDSPDLAPDDLARMTAGVSEYNAYEITNLGPKVGTPVAYPRPSLGVTTYRLQPNAGLYEGVRFAWLWANATPTVPWHITGLRLVCQVKPTNWGGAFAASGDDLLSKIWYAGAYTVKVNLLSAQFGSILIYRGDRFSWTGDAHVAQGTAMAALGNYAFVAQNLDFTRSNCNGIESYCLYFVASVVDYYTATGDADTVAYLLPFVEDKLQHAWALFWAPKPPSIGFTGWDDRLGSGFSDASCPESEALYHFLSIRSWRAWAAVMSSTGNATAAAAYTSWADKATATVRAAGPAWWQPLGLFAASDAINAGIPTPVETSALITKLFNSSVTGCGLSNFNTYFELEALAKAGELDRGYALIHHCWDVQLNLGATTVWETSKPDWTSFLQPNDGIPGFEDGFTSMAHPWGSGATSWATKWLMGIRPDVAHAGYASLVVEPHVAGSMTGVSGTVSTLRGPVSVHAARGEGRGAVAHVGVHVPTGSTAALRLSATLLRRLGVSVDEGTCGADDAACTPALTAEVWETAAALDAEGAPQACLLTAPEAAGVALREGEAGLTVRRVRLVLNETATHKGDHAAVLHIHGACVALRFPVPVRPAAPSTPPPNPYPPAAYPATFIRRDVTTQGSWVGVYGSAGYALFAYDGVNKPLESLPPYVSAVVQTFGHAQNGPWPTPGNDTRALQDPRLPTGPRKIGQYSVPVPGTAGWDPSYPIDVILAPQAVGNVTYQVAVYCVDFDGRGRRQTVDALDGDTFSTVSPVQLLADFTGGVWLVWQYNRSLRLRVNYIRGDNQVVSAILFDTVA